MRLLVSWLRDFVDVRRSAGPERSVAATKTYTGQVLMLYLVAHALGARIRVDDAGRNPRVVGRRGEPLAVGGRRLAEVAFEARGEGADALQPDREADVGDGTVGRPQQAEGGGGVELALGLQATIFREPTGTFSRRKLPSAPTFV